MATVRAKGSLVTYVDGEPVSVAAGDEITVSDKRAKGLIDSGLFEDAAEAAEQRDRSVTPSRTDRGDIAETVVEVDEAAHTDPERAAEEVRASLDSDPAAGGDTVTVEVDEAAHTDPDRAAEVVQASLDSEPAAAPETVVVEVDEAAHTDPDRAAEEVRATAPKKAARKRAARKRA
jgi:hypothetical protein